MMEIDGSPDSRANFAMSSDGYRWLFVVVVCTRRVPIKIDKLSGGVVHRGASGRIDESVYYVPGIMTLGILSSAFK